MAGSFVSGCWSDLTEWTREGANYRALGSTTMRNLLENYRVQSNCKLLFLDAGNVQHVMKTVAGLSQQYTANELKTKAIDIHVCDHDVTVLARNMVLLEMLTCLNPNEHDDMVFLWSVWFNVQLSKTHYDRLQHLLRRMSASTDTTCAYWKLNNEESMREIQTILRKWSTQNFSLSSVMTSRQSKRTEFKPSSFCLTSPFFQFNEIATNRSYLTEYEQSGCMNPVVTGEPTRNKLVNPTMLQPGNDVWNQTDVFQPLEAFAPLNRSHPVDNTTAQVELCFCEFVSEVKHYQQSLLHGKVTITGWHSNSLELCQTQLASSQFHVIDTGSLIDRYGLSTVLITCGKLLYGTSSVLRAASTKWGMFSRSLDNYLEQSFGCNPLMMPTLYQMRLVEEIELGTSELHSATHFWGYSCDLQELLFMPALAEMGVPLVLSEHDHILEFIDHHLKLCMPWRVSDDGERVFVADSAKYGTTPCSLNTLLHLLLRLQHTFSGGGRVLEEYISSMMQQEKWMQHYRLAWEALTAFSGLHECSKKCVEIAVPLNVPKTKPPNIGNREILTLATIVITDIRPKKCGEVEVQHLFPVFQFVPEGNLCKFLLLERDFNSFSPKANVHLSYSRIEYSMINNLMKNTTHEGKSSSSPFASAVIMENSETPHREAIDDCGSETNNPSKVKMKVCEEEEQYEVSVSVENKGHPMTVEPEFNPRTSPTQMTLTIHVKEIGYSCTETLVFSCPLLIGNTKIQYSSKRGCVSVVAPKSISEHSPLALAKPELKLSQLPKFEFKNMDFTVFRMSFAQAEDKESDKRVSHFRRLIFAIHDVRRQHPDTEHIEFLETDEGATVIGLDILNVYIYKGLPLFEVLVMVPDVVRKMLGQGKLSNDKYMATMTRRRVPKQGTFISLPSVKYGAHLLKKMLYFNSLSLDQDGFPGHGPQIENSWFYRSFVQIMFNRTMAPSGKLSMF